MFEDRSSGHRTGMKNPFVDNKCKILSQNFHVGICRNANYLFNIIQKFYESQKDDYDTPIPGLTVGRQKKEMKWMLILQTAYRYDLNDRLVDEYMAEKESSVVGD